MWFLLSNDSVKKEAFVFLPQRNLWTEFLDICSWCSSLYHHLKTLFPTEILWEWGPNKWKSDLDYLKDVAAVPNQIDWWFSLFLLYYKVLSWWSLLTNNLRKGKVIMHNFVCYIHRNSLLFSNVLYYSFS